MSLFSLACYSSYLTEAEMFQKKLDETTRLLRELQEAQNERLSTRPPPYMICLLGPSYREMHLGRSHLREKETWGIFKGKNF